MSDGRVLLDRDAETGIARHHAQQSRTRNSYDPAMREALGAYLDDLALDDDIKVVVLRGAGGVFSTGADMGNAYSWYEIGADGAQRRRTRRAATRVRGARVSAGDCRSTARRSRSTTTFSATRRPPWPRCRASRSAADSSSR